MTQEGKTTPRRHRSPGLTMIELLIVIAVIAALIISLMFAVRTQLLKARDARRKADLEKIKVAFENYYNDDQCYPPDDILEVCEGDQLQPYLDKVPCDPAYDLPYCYIPDGSSCSQSFKVLAPLANHDDPIIEKLLCHLDQSCGYEAECAQPSADYSGFNYGVTSGNVGLYNPDYTPPPSPSPSTAPSPSPSPTPSPTPDPSGFNYACQPPDELPGAATCNNYADPVANDCPLDQIYTYEEVCTINCCQGACSNPDNWCTN